MQLGNKKIWVVAFCFVCAVMYQQCTSSKTSVKEQPATAQENAVQTQQKAPALTIESADIALATNEAPASGQKEKEGAAPEGGTPRLVIATPVYDAGEVWEGDTVTHSFVVRNTGNGTLAINQVKPG